MKYLHLVILLILAFNVYAKEKIALTSYDSCPYTCVDQIHKGALVDIVEAIFKNSPYEPEITIYPFKRALISVQKHAHDGVIGIIKRQAPDLVFPQLSIGKTQYEMFVGTDDDWIYNGLSSLSNRRIGVKLGISYGALDSYINYHSSSPKKIHLHPGRAHTMTMARLIEAGRINMFLEDRNTMALFSKWNRDHPFKRVGSLPPDSLYIAFNGPKANTLAKLITDGLIKLRTNGELNKILKKYNMEDWVNWEPSEFNPFYGDYLTKLEERFPTKYRKKVNSGTIIFEASVNRDSLYWKYALKFRERLEINSNNRFSVKLVFGKNSEHDIVMHLAENNTQMGMVAINNYTPYAPSAGILSVPYFFPSIQSAQKLFRHKHMDLLTERAARESNVRPISYFIGGYRFLSNNIRPIKKTSDLENLKIRVPNNQFMVEAFRAWGIDPYPLAWPDVYPALESGRIDGQENPINIMFAGINMKNKAWNSNKYVTQIKYFLFTAPHLVSESFYQSLSASDQETLIKSAREAEEYIWMLAQKEEKKDIEIGKKNGMVFTQPENEEGDWKAKATRNMNRFYFRAGGKEYVSKFKEIVRDEL